MHIDEFDYNLPEELIAQHPVEPRDASRLLVLDKKTGGIEHTYFHQIGRYLKPGDVMVIGNRYQSDSRPNLCAKRKRRSD